MILLRMECPSESNVSNISLGRLLSDITITMFTI